MLDIGEGMANALNLLISFVALACDQDHILAIGLIDQGMNWWQALLTIALGNVIVLVPILLNAHPGTKYGIPFPVLARASFGTQGANVPVVLRAIVADLERAMNAGLGGLDLFAIEKSY